MRRTGADFGVAFDGDGDRAIFVDERGEPVSSDLVTALLARAVLRPPPRRDACSTTCARAAPPPEEIRAAGGVAEMCRVGHSFVKAQMRETRRALRAASSRATSTSASRTRSSPTTAAPRSMALLDVLGAERRPLSELVAPLRRYAASGEISRRVPTSAGLLAAIEAEHRGSARVSHLDGLLVEYPDWWFNLRPSNTEPVLRLNLEADGPRPHGRRTRRLVARMERGRR